jgi:hypothetical protein
MGDGRREERYGAFDHDNPFCSGHATDLSLRSVMRWIRTGCLRCYCMRCITGGTTISTDCVCQHTYAHGKVYLRREQNFCAHLHFCGPSHIYHVLFTLFIHLISFACLP